MLRVRVLNSCGRFWRFVQLQMTATDLSKLADLLEQDSLPSWLREEIDRRTSDILSALKRGQSIKLTGPHGEELVIGPVPEAAVV